MKPATLRVTYRIARNGNPDTLTAILPDVPANPGNFVCYAHLGQHSECSHAWYRSTRPATKTEYKALARELESIYRPDYALRIVQRISNRRRSTQ